MFHNRIKENLFIETFQEKLNYIKYCSSNVVPGCSPPSTTSADYELFRPAFLMPDGVMVGNFDEGGTYAELEDIFVDLNGASAPNAVGQDQFAIILNYGPNNGTILGARPGQVACATSMSASQQQVCRALFE